MKITDILARDGPCISFEFFPPKTPEGEAALMRTIEALKPLGPGFVSVTRTGTKPREAPVELVTRIRALGIEAAAHVTCIEASRAAIAAHCDLLAGRGIENVVAIRGDVPQDPAFRRPASRRPPRGGPSASRAPPGTGYRRACTPRSRGCGMTNPPRWPSASRGRPASASSSCAAERRAFISTPSTSHPRPGQYSRISAARGSSPADEARLAADSRCLYQPTHVP